MAKLTPEAIAILRRKGRRQAHANRLAKLDRSDLLAIYGTKLLAKAGLIERPEANDDEYTPADPDSIGRNGNLRPTWQGRA